METRSDWTLELQLGIAQQAAASEEVTAAIAAAVAHMKGGRGGHRRGGKALVRLLQEARARTAEAGEWQVVRLVQDSLDYAERRILKPDFEQVPADPASEVSSHLGNEDGLSLVPMESAVTTAKPRVIQNAQSRYSGWS
ncbi:hypothetical protein ACIRPK_28585 [Kitasatospora sp. NPDC101801]|uniref:hypothetical protein n=1 Tax=Kitasatospora sp. NPDC101801 TaxID=3364103 RepID=UPI0037FF0CEE